ncbi:hypothetical protein IGI04_034096 [Brassica rapa subsp. trilocularis]|uniref:Uncharacterized protein n=1 Tax=Brassica rapa subsp. trilocularis TaxID=1813537 RepID=A0ABQ7LBJ8_BRACM|nr:hypothetical protein IGI04_034096 [Brassica rapa subsp. trilocularis]
MELELPKRVYAEGLEPQVKKINNCCRMELIRDLKKAMFAEYDNVKIDPVFKHIIAIAENKLKFSGKLVDRSLHFGPSLTPTYLCIIRLPIV